MRGLRKSEPQFAEQGEVFGLKSGKTSRAAQAAKAAKADLDEAQMLFHAIVRVVDLNETVEVDDDKVFGCFWRLGRIFSGC